MKHLLKAVSLILVLCICLPMLFACSTENTENTTEEATKDILPNPTDTPTETPTSSEEASNTPTEEDPTSRPTEDDTNTPSEDGTDTPSEDVTEAPSEDVTNTPTEDSTEAPHIHSEVIDAAIAPTCNKTGLTEGKHCSECGEVTVAQEILSVIPHTEVVDSAVAPTCISTGLTEGKHCSECSEIIAKQEVVEMTKHSYDVDDKCIYCGKTLQPTEGLQYTLINGGTEYQVSGMGTATDTDVVIPSEYNGLPVTSIGDYAFYMCSRETIVMEQIHDGRTYLTSIKLSDSIKSIGTYAFAGCTSLTKIVIPEGVTSIGDGAFIYCLSLSSITIPESVTSLGSDAFDRCLCLIEICNKSSLNISNDRSSDGCVVDYALNIYTPESGESKLYTTDDGYVFYIDGETRYLVKYTGKEINLTLPADCRGHNYEIYQGAFCCSPVQSVTISDGVTNIYPMAFYDCPSLISISIPENIETIGNYAFASLVLEICNKSSLNITVGDEIAGFALNVYTPKAGESKLHTTDDGYVFYIDGETRYLVKYIGDETHLTLPADCQGHNYEIYKGAFTSLPIRSITIPESVTSIGDEAFFGCAYLTSIIIPDSVTSIGYEAFEACESLISVTIGKNVTSIGEHAFQSNVIEVYNRSLLDIAITDGDNTANGSVARFALNVYTPDSGESKLHTTDDGYIFYLDGGSCYLVKYIGSNTSITLPTNFQGHNYSIYEEAFMYCSSLTSVTIPDGITGIGEYAFYGCRSLTSIAIPESVIHIDDSAFRLCPSLASVSITEGIEQIGYYAFYQCSPHMSISFSGTKEEWKAIPKLFYMGMDPLTMRPLSCTVYCTDGTIAKDGTET